MPKHLIRGGAMPAHLKRGEVIATKDAVTQAARRILPVIAPHSRGGGPSMCILSAEGCERRAAFAKEEGNHAEARRALAEAASWRAHAETLRASPVKHGP